MKSYFLEALSDDGAARRALSQMFPGQVKPWLLMTDDGSDVVAYLNVEQEVEDILEGPFIIQADVSGRHYNEDRKVLNALRILQSRLGGSIRDDFDNVL